MKKLDILIHHLDHERVTNSLEALGVVHIAESNAIESEKQRELINQRTALGRGIKILEAYGKSPTQKSEPIFSDQNLLELVEEIKTTANQVASLEKQLDELTQKHQVAVLWGISSVSVFNELQEKGLQIRLYEGSRKTFEQFDFGEINVDVIWKKGKRLGFVCLSNNNDLKIPFEEVKFPIIGFKALEKEIFDKKAEIEKIKQILLNYQQYIPNLNQKLQEVNQGIIFQKTLHAYDQHAEGNLMSITGWFPQSVALQLQSFLEKSDIAWSVSDPTPQDKPPIILKNNYFSKLFEPITNIFQLPHYFELDLTPFIAVFYPLFFAYCLGDAGYGLVLLVLSLVAYATIFKTKKNLAILGVILGLMTSLMGIVKSGSVFGIPLLLNTDIAFFEFLSRFVFIHDDQSFILNAFNVAIMVGVVQILVAIVLSIYKEFAYVGKVAALAPLGKLMIVLGVLVWFLYQSQGVEALAPYQPLANFLMVAGMLMFLLFKNLKERLGMRLGGNLLPLFFIFTNILGDILSYVRLFALGVASAVLGLVVNQIGMQIWDAGWYGIVVGPVFLLLGHSLNMGLAVLGAFVHPLRLTFVEFYNNAQFEGGGFPYSPFGKKNQLT